MPQDQVKFECHWQMTKSDVKEYLEKVYNVKILDVRTEIERGKYMEHPAKKNALSPPLPDRKFAYVQLMDEKFTFPDLFEKKKQSDDIAKQEKQMNNQLSKIQNANKDRLDIGNWFF